jgi:hypothetical protein
MMSRLAAVLAGLLSCFLAPLISFAQQADAPMYQEGDWWRVKIEVARPEGVSVAGAQLGGFPEYRVQIDSGKERVFGLRGDMSKEVEAPAIVSLVLGKKGWLGELLRFPLRVGSSWTEQFQFQPPGTLVTWQNGRYEVQSWEKILTPNGESDAFKIVMNMNIPTGPKGKGTRIQTSTYYYSPAAKAIISFRQDGGQAAVKSSLVEANVSR